MSPYALDGKLWIAWLIYWMLAARGMKKTVASESRVRRLLYQAPLLAGFVAIFSHAFDYGLLGRPFVGPSAQWVGAALTFIGLLLAVAGSALTAGKLVGIPAFLVIAASFVWKLRLEERFMLRQFGEQYERYRREVKALVPFVV